MGGEFKGMSSRSVDIALNEAFGKHVDPWLDMLKTSCDGRGLREDDIQALLFSNRAQGVSENKSYFPSAYKASTSSAASSKAENVRCVSGHVA